MKISKKKVIIYSVNDEIFTFPVLYQICKILNQKYLIEIYFGKTKFKKENKDINYFFSYLVQFYLLKNFL